MRWTVEAWSWTRHAIPDGRCGLQVASKGLGAALPMRGGRRYTVQGAESARLRSARCRLEEGHLPEIVGGAAPRDALSGRGAGLHVDCSSFASMAAVRLPDMSGVAKTSAAAQELRSRLRHEHAVEAPVAAWEGALWVRVSAAMYNTVADFEALATAVIAAGERAGADRGMAPLPSMRAAADRTLKPPSTRSVTERTLSPMPSMRGDAERSLSPLPSIRGGKGQVLSPLPSISTLDRAVRRGRSQRDEALTDVLVGDGTDASADMNSLLFEVEEGTGKLAVDAGGSETDVDGMLEQTFSAEHQMRSVTDSFRQRVRDGVTKGAADEGGASEGPWPVSVDLVADKAGVKLDLSTAQ